MVERQSNHHSDFQFKSRLVSFEMMDNELVGLVNSGVGIFGPGSQEKKMLSLY